MKCVPSIAPDRKQRPGGNEVPAMAEERSFIVKSVSGSGEKTSNSRLTSVNCAKCCEITDQVHKSNQTHIVIAVQIYVIRVVVCSRCRVRKMNQRLSLSIFGRQRWYVISPKMCPRRAKHRLRLGRSKFFLRQTNALVSCHRDAAVRPNVTGIVAPLNPRLSKQVVKVHIIQPDI